MVTNYHVFGPYEISFEKSGKAKRIPRDIGRIFWSHELKAIAKKQGCYVFAIRAGRGFTPWYVGKTKRCFEDEIFTSHKLVKYNAPLFTCKRGTPVMFFICKTGTKKIMNQATLKDMERELIQVAYFKNSSLTNKKHAKNKRWAIAGVTSGKKPTIAASKFKKMMWA